MSIGYTGRPIVRVAQDAITAGLLAEDTVKCYGTSKHVDLIVIEGAGFKKSAEFIAKELGQSGLIIQQVDDDEKCRSALVLKGADDFEWEWDPTAMQALEALGKDGDLPEPRFSGKNPKSKSKDTYFSKIKEVVNIDKKVNEVRKSSTQKKSA